MNLNSLDTNRLWLVPITLEISTSLVNGSTQEIEKLGLKTDGKWPREDTMDVLPIINEVLKKNKTPSGFELWMIVKKDSMKIIGDIGFYGKPNEKGEVVVGYGLIEQERTKGFGFEALGAIINWAVNQKSVKIIKADCLIDNIASVRILEKVGMKEVSRDKVSIYWELIKPLC